MRMYKVKSDGTLNIIVGSLMKEASKTPNRYRVRAKMIKGQDNKPEDIVINITCDSGEHYNFSAKERQKYNVEDQWTNVLKPVMERAAQLFEANSVEITHDERTSDNSNRDKYKKDKAVSTETVPSPSKVTTPTQEKEVEEDIEQQEEERRPDIQI